MINSAVTTNTLNIKLDSKIVEEFDTNYAVVDTNKVLDNKVVFGKLLVNIRTSNEIILTSILGNITDTATDNRYLYLNTVDESIYRALSKKDNLDILNSNLKKFTHLTAMPRLIEKASIIDVEKILKDKFKGIITITE